jgi:hypothetical protein
MKLFFSFLLPLSVVVVMSSCRKTAIEDPQPTPVVDSLELFAKLRDSASYTIDGNVFQCPNISGESRGNAGANYDTINRKWNTDTTQFHVSYTYSNSSVYNAPYIAWLKLVFVKNFKTTEMGTGPLPGIKWPTLTEQMKMFALGQHPYTLDYDRFNYQNGIAMEVRDINNKFWTTYVDKFSSERTTIPTNAQANSVFEVTRLQKLRGNDYDYLLEARFSAAIFDANEQSKKITGYIRVKLTAF